MIDAHVHILLPQRSASAVRWLKKSIPWVPVDESISESEILEELDALGISHFFNHVYPLKPEESRSLNEYNYQLSKRAKNAVCFGSVHPSNRHRTEIVKEAILDFGLIGLKFHPFVQGFNLLDERMDDIYGTMEEMNRPIVFHTGFDRFYGMPMKSEEMEKILTRYPDLVVVIAHMFYPHTDQAFRLMESHANVYLDGTNIFSDYREPFGGKNIFEGMLVGKGQEEQYNVFFNHPLEDLEKYSHKLMFGSDYPVAMNNLERIYDFVKGQNMAPEALENITERTAVEFVERFSPDFFGERSFRKANHNKEKK